MLITETPRLRLRELAYGDEAFVRALVNDPEWLRWIGDRNVHSDADARGYIDRVRTGYEKHGHGLWVIEARADGALLGLCGLLRRDWLAHPDVGYALLPAARGQGIAREALEATLVLAHARYGASEVSAITVPEHTASQRLLESVGFALVGTVSEDGSGVTLSHFLRRLP